MITISKKIRKGKLVEKTCQYPDCGKTFFGQKNAKYCPEHRDPAVRIRKRPEPVQDTINQEIHLNRPEGGVEHRTCQCALEGCNQTFQITVQNSVSVYPKYCPEHRSEYKRQRHLASLGITIHVVLDHIDTVEEPSEAEIEALAADFSKIKIF